MGTLIVEKKTTMSELNKMPNPVPATKWHKPIPHFQAITSVINNIESRGLEISDLEVGTSHKNQRCFWLAKLKSKEGDYAPMIGGRNAHDRSVSLALYGGASIFICSNLMVSAKFQDRRKHMGDIQQELPELIQTSIDRVLMDNTINKKRISYYKNQSLSDKDAYYFMIDAMKKEILGPSKIKYLVEQWENPLHDEFSNKNAWSLHNCFTEVFKDLTSADLVYHRNTVLNGMLDDFTDFKKPIIDITPAKPKEEKTTPVVVKTKLKVNKPKKKAKVNIKRKKVVVSDKHKKLLKSKNIQITNTGADVLADILNVPISKMTKKRKEISDGSRLRAKKVMEKVRLRAKKA
ncbi:MAG: hypothetical protein Unbinned2902contig1001_33 [Prokaryotic dsDNA virus sp.]|nr:MAG: hypothetical protein Unbinned2902contig1001_33 [Prokaryotic dsDNA virus sp.]|tara:strand:+ start:23321 stop:24364 length:1044 start_codon:yes stop_codon:yes gene_type:complete